MGKARNLSVLLAADGQVEDAKIDGVSSSKLSGALPAISGANLTGVAPTKTTIENLGIAASSLTGALPAISGASLTSLPSQTENDFTDTLKTKLDGVEASAKDDQTAAEIKTAYESNSDTNEFSDAEQTKLSGIEASADVTDSTNVASAGAVMESDATTAAMSFVVDEDNMASNSATKLSTQQAIKAYVDNQINLVPDAVAMAIALG